MKKTNLISILIFLLAVSLASSLVSAEEGCYLYKESMLYCLDLEREEVLNDCMIYEDCDFEKVFFGGRNCGDLKIFPECKEVFCKSTCDYEFLGKCWGGEVPAGEESVWCKAGCCRFEYYGGKFCEFKKNKWLCELEARNREMEGFNLEMMDEQQCKRICKPLILEEMVTEGLMVEEEERITPEPEEGISEGISWIWIILVSFLLAIIFFLVYRRYKPKREKVLMEPKAKKKPRFFVRREAIKEREERIRKLKEEMEYKRKEKEREELFGLFGLSKEERKLTHVDLLDKITKVHELKDRRRLREEDTFRKLERFVSELTEKEKKKEEEKSTKKEAKNVFEKLKGIIRGKK